jgi:3-oxoacyl-[acyl-carrier protein] reductase
MASIAGKEGNARNGQYSTSKAAVIGLTKSLGKELATTGVLVNAVAPAVIETDIIRAEGIDPAVTDYLISKIPMGRMGQPIEVARLVGFLVSDHLTFSTGAVYDLSGGRATY